MLSQVQAKPMDSPFWKGIMRVKYDFLTKEDSALVMENKCGFGRIFG